MTNWLLCHHTGGGEFTDIHFNHMPRERVPALAQQKVIGSYPKKWVKRTLHKEDFLMLFMNIYTYKEGKREEIIKRRLEMGTGTPDGVKIIGEWTDLSGTGGYLVFETDKANYAWTMAWNDLLDMEIIPILDTEKDVMGLLKQGS